jgi:lycopene cyclase domain-containing protein
MFTVFIALVALYKGLKFRYSRLLIIVVALLLVTIIFDNIIIIIGFVAYDPNHISGIILGRLPIEDLDYALVAATLVPLLWEYPDLKRQQMKRKDSS